MLVKIKLRLLLQVVTRLTDYKNLKLKKKDKQK